jgi:hypothetical protein
MIKFLKETVKLEVVNENTDYMARLERTEM